jgi:hypothetical protein
MRRLVLLALLYVTPAAAQERVDIRVLRFAERGESLVVSGTFTDAFDRELLEQLSSGFAQTVAVHLWVYPSGSDAAIWYAAATYRAVYAVWDEVYLVRLRDPKGERNLRFASRAEALKALTTLDEFPVAPLSAIPVGPRHFVGVLVEVNPVGAELLAEVRRWLARPRGAQVGGDASFFGSFVSVFVNPKVASADRVLRFRSQDFYRTGGP